MVGLTTTRERRCRVSAGARLAAAALCLSMPAFAAAQPAAGRSDAFQVEEATIEGIHRAIRDGRTSCQGVVQAYVDRARAYNGACTRLVTLDGAPVEPASGPVRAGAPVRFPTSTVPVSSILPDFDRYRGMPLDLGRMEPTLSDPTVQAQYGMVAGVPGAGQVNALSTLNLRGERSVSCPGACDAHPETGEIPADCPAACDAFRRQPDALERAAELDARYGSDPDLTAMPMYCIPLGFKDVYDTRDMRTTTAADIDFAMDAPPPTRPSSSGCARRAPSSTPRPTRPSSTAASATPAGRPPRPPATWATRSGARGADRPATPTTPSARRGARARGRASRSPRTSSPAPSASRREGRARGRRRATPPSAC